MKHIIQFLLLTIPLISHAQFDFDDKNWGTKTIGFGCGVGGASTDIVSDMHHLFADHNFEEIKRKLESEKNGEQFLAAFILEKLDKKKEITLDNSELEKIKAIKKSENLVQVCSGCTYWDKVPLNQLMDKKHPIYKSAESWFKHYYKRYYK